MVGYAVGSIAQVLLGAGEVKGGIKALSGVRGLKGLMTAAGATDQMSDAEKVEKMLQFVAKNQKDGTLKQADINKIVSVVQKLDKSGHKNVVSDVLEKLEQEADQGKNGLTHDVHGKGHVSSDHGGNGKVTQKVSSTSKGTGDLAITEQSGTTKLKTYLLDTNHTLQAEVRPTGFKKH